MVIEHRSAVKMVTEAKNKKNLKLSNWHIFFLEKLNQFYNKGSFCDVTLKFNDENFIQAHKLVLKACTNFFDNLPSSSTGVMVLHMPKTMKVDHCRPIINFMYTGKLEYRTEDQSHIISIARHLGMSVIVELLQAQQPTVSNNVDQKGLFKKYVQRHVPTKTNLQNSSSLDSSSIPLTEITSPSGALPGKKLPIWKKRTPFHLPEEVFRSVNNQKPVVHQSVCEPPRPTRFEWPDEEVLPDVELSQSFSMDSCETLSYDSKIILKPVDDPKPVITEDFIDKMPTTLTIQRGAKRARFSEVVRGNPVDDDDYDDDGHFETIHDIEDDIEDEPIIINNGIHLTTIPKPILKSSEMTTSTPTKKVRFAFTEENDTSSDCAVKTSSSTFSQITTSSVSTVQVATPTTSITTATSSTSTTPTNSINHAKIINEILKKYPDLVKQNKNIKLKIQSGGTSGSSTVQNTVLLDKDGKGQKKVQYVVLKSDFTNMKKEIKNEVIMGAENRTGPWFCVSCGNDSSPMNFDSYYTYRKHLQEVHNERIDARICEHCGLKTSKRNLHLYHLYTKHNIPPPRNINFPKCDQCNYIALSESLLIKHRSNHTGMMSKEYVCRVCHASFKSNGALMGHMQTNLHHMDHMTKKDYECEYCGKIFNRNINLKAHIRTNHQEENRKMYEDEDRIDEPPEIEVIPEQRNQNVMEVIEVPVFDSGPGSNKTLYLPQGMTILAESPAVPLMPSSESEAMNNVATGIATSINITDRNISNDVIVIDGRNELILRGTPATYLLNQDGSYSVQEYIVPEIMAESGQVYTTALVSTAPNTGISYVNSDNISIITSATDHTYADGMKINGHVNPGAQVSLVSSNGPTVIASQVQASQPSQQIIVQEPIIMNADWVQSISTSQNQSLTLGQGQKVEIISTPVSVTQVSNRASLTQTSPQVETVTPVVTAHTLVSDWGDLEEDNQEDSQTGDEESDIKPSRPTIELSVSDEM